MLRRTPLAVRPARPRWRALLMTAWVPGLVTLGLVTQSSPAGADVPAASAQVAQVALAANLATPGDFTGFGFDQCLAPDQGKMSAWMESSPFTAVGIYVSGASRACRDQPNLTPAWVATNLAAGWRLLPITLGPQAYCNPRFPRYGEPLINGSATNGYAAALEQGRAEAGTAAAAAAALGIVPGSTLWYDLEGYDYGNVGCRESSLQFLSGWTQGLHALGYVSGVYSSAGSGILALDDARVNRPGLIALPDRIWVARWDLVANTSTSYIREDGWRPGGRVKQYQGGHDETWGGVTINIDRNYLELGNGSVAPAESHCGGVPVDFDNYKGLNRRKARNLNNKPLVKALACLLKEQGVHTGKVRRKYGKRLRHAVHDWQARYGLPVSGRWSRTAWMTLLSAGAPATVKIGSSGPSVRMLQRALDARSKHARLAVTGGFDGATDAVLREWQTKVGLEASGVAGVDDWALLRAGRRR